MERPIAVADPHDCRRFSDLTHCRLVPKSWTADLRHVAIARAELRGSGAQLDRVVALIARSMELRTKSLRLLNRPVYRPALIAKPVERAGKPHFHTEASLHTPLPDTRPQ
ncbi:MAG: hypothetical protein AB7U95_04855 [Reyranella sp.]